MAVGGYSGIILFRYSDFLFGGQVKKMMSRSITLKSISSRLRKALDNEYYNDSERMKTLLEDVLSDIEIYSEHGIDFRAVADALDDSLVIADGEGRYIY